MVKLIACIGPNGELGKDNDLVYSNKEDMNFFRKTTLKSIVIMGGNTFKSLGSKPLPKRLNVVLSPEDLDAEGIIQFKDKTLEEAIEFLKNMNPVYDLYIIGGAYVYNEAIRLSLADELLLTIMNDSVDADVFVDMDAIEDNYKITKILDHVKEDGKEVGRIVQFERR